jgi:hypothetical protein
VAFKKATSQEPIYAPEGYSVGEALLVRAIDAQELGFTEFSPLVPFS